MDAAAPMTSQKRIASVFIACVVLILCSGIRIRSADAHAELTGSNPGAGAALSTIPAQLSLTFSEAVNPALSSISLLDADGATVALGEVSTDPGDSHVLVAPVLASDSRLGVFTVVWGSYSAEDGHASSGSFTFSAGTGEAPIQPGSHATGATSWSIAGNWLELIGLVLLTGLAVFAASSGVPPRPAFATAMAALAGTGLAGALISFHARNAAIGGRGMVAIPQRDTIVDLLDSTYGHAWLVRVALLAVALAVAMLSRRHKSRSLRAAMAIGGFFGLGTIAISGHAGAVDRMWLAAGVDWLHLAAASIWLGGLLGLLLLLSPSANAPGEKELLQRQGNRFVVAVLLIVTSGVASAWWHIGGRRSLTQSDYGQILLVKVGLVGAILGVAYYNWRVLQSMRAKSYLIPVAIGAELVLATIVLLFSADLSQTPPANQPLPVQVAARAIELHKIGTSGETIVALSGILTGDPTDKISIDVTPAADVQRIIVHSVLMSSSSIAPVGDRFDATAVEVGAGEFYFPAGRLGISGPWELEVTVRRAGVPDEIVSIPVDTSALATRGTRTAIDEWGGFRLTSHSALALVLAASMLVIGLGGLRRITGMEPLASGFLLAATLLIAGGFLVSAARGINPVTPEHKTPNPLDTSVGALTYAGELYRLNCAVCHGPTGKGVGSADAAHLHGSDADLTQGQTAAQSAGDLRYWIEHGVPGTRMPAFGSALTEDEQWQLVLLIRQLQEDARVEATQE